VPGSIPDPLSFFYAVFDFLFAPGLAYWPAGWSNQALKAQTITTAVPILTLSPDSRSAALGEAGVAISPDANSAYYNAGKLGFVTTKYSVSPSYTPWLRTITDDMGLGFLSGYAKIGTRSAVSASLMYFDLGQIEYRNINNIPGGTFNPKEYALTVSYGQKLTENFGVGVSARYIRSNLTGAPAAPMPSPAMLLPLIWGLLHQGGHHRHWYLQPGFWGVDSQHRQQNHLHRPQQPQLSAHYAEAGHGHYPGNRLLQQADAGPGCQQAAGAFALLRGFPYNTNDPVQKKRVKTVTTSVNQQNIVSGILSFVQRRPGRI
jgi:hypothetical protein